MSGHRPCRSRRPTAGLCPPDTVGYSHVTGFDTPGYRTVSRSYSQQYQHRADAPERRREPEQLHRCLGLREQQPIRHDVDPGFDGDVTAAHGHGSVLAAQPNPLVAEVVDCVEDRLRLLATVEREYPDPDRIAVGRRTPRPGARRGRSGPLIGGYRVSSGRLRRECPSAPTRLPAGPRPGEPWIAAVYPGRPV